jgi:cytochrome c553
MQCGACHLPDFRGREQMPRLAGQREEYLTSAMLAYRDNRRVGADTMMSGVLYGVSDSDIRALAHFLSRSR